eukprot:scaffold128_cov248-Pinguiococcus_pyrenoidosus.AAC.18
MLRSSAAAARRQPLPVSISARTGTPLGVPVCIATVVKAPVGRPHGPLPVRVPRALVSWRRPTLASARGRQSRISPPRLPVPPRARRSLATSFTRGSSITQIPAPVSPVPKAIVLGPAAGVGQVLASPPVSAAIARGRPPSPAVIVAGRQRVTAGAGRARA